MGRRGALALALLAACGGKPARPHHDGGDAGSRTAAVDAAAAPVTPDGAAAPYRLAAVGAGEAGTIAVSVLWPDAPAAVRASPGYTRCATARPPAATIGALHGVAGAVVMLDGITAGKPPPPVVPVRLAVRDCAVTPAVAVVPRLGGTLEVQAQDDTGHVVVITGVADGVGGAGDVSPPVPRGVGGAAAVSPPAPSTRAQLPAWGHTVSLPLSSAGVLRIVADDAADAAYVVVTDQPYAAVTDDDGAASLDQVPAGTYAVVAWLPPSAGGPAQRARGQATVVAGDRVEVTLRLGS